MGTGRPHRIIVATENLAALLGEQCFGVSLPDLDVVGAIRELINEGMDAVFARCDVILRSAALVPAPEGPDDTRSF
jgi:hypothetical protein